MSPVEGIFPRRLPIAERGVKDASAAERLCPCDGEDSVTVVHLGIFQIEARWIEAEQQGHAGMIDSVTSKTPWLMAWKCRSATDSSPGWERRTTWLSDRIGLAKNNTFGSGVAAAAPNASRPKNNQVNLCMTGPGGGSERCTVFAGDARSFLGEERVFPCFLRSLLRLCLGFKFRAAAPRAPTSP
jgi:hypothetical protein